MITRGFPNCFLRSLTSFDIDWPEAIVRFFDMLRNAFSFLNMYVVFYLLLKARGPGDELGWVCVHAAQPAPLLLWTVPSVRFPRVTQ